MSLKKKTMIKIRKSIKRFMNFLKYRSVGPHVLSKKDLKDLVRNGYIKDSKPTKTAVLEAYEKTHSLASDGIGAPRPMRQGAVDFLERMFVRYADKSSDQLEADLLSAIEGTLMPIIDRHEGKEIYDVLKDKKIHTKYLGNALNDKVKGWQHRWKTIVSTELNRASNWGALDAAIHNNKGKSPGEIYMYKLGIDDSAKCSYCRKFWLTEDGKTPKVYKMAELMANGSNIGKKAKDWKATIDSTHPNCFTEGRTPVLTDNGWKQIKNIKIGENVLTHTGKFKRVIDLINKPYKYKKCLKITYRYLNEEFSVSVTKDHKFLINNEWKEAKNIKIDDKLTRLIVPCAICDNEVDFCKNTSHKKQRFKLNNVCSKKCFNKLMSKNVQNYHDNLSEDDKIKRAANCSDGVKRAYLEGRLSSIFANGYWTKERRQSQSEWNLANQAMLNKASASTRISREQKLVYGWFLNRYDKKNIQLEYCVDNYAIDIAFIDDKIGIEIDGRFHNDERRKLDNIRDNNLKQKGWKIFRYGFNCKKSVSKKNVFEDIDRILNNHDERYSFGENEIISIEEYQTSQNSRIYCLTVEQDESFISRGIVSHNCRDILQELKPGWGFDGSGSLEYISKEHNEYNKQRKKNET